MTSPNPGVLVKHLPCKGAPMMSPPDTCKLVILTPTIKESEPKNITVNHENMEYENVGSLIETINKNVKIFLNLLASVFFFFG